MTAPTLTVIGLDAATFTVIDPLLAQGELPNLARLFESGSRGVLRSTTHPLTPHAWATMVTGVNAARHGIWDFAERDETGYQLRLVNGSFRRAPAVWDRLSAANRRVGLVNIPFTWPAPAVNGFALAGFDAAARESGMTAPPELVAELQQRFGSLELDNRFPIGKDGRLDLDLVRRAASQKVEITRWLHGRFQPELLFVVFMAADHIHHLGWKEWERDGARSSVAEVYRILDAAVGSLVDSIAPGGDVLLVSDHGGGDLEGVVNLNAWLAAKGYLAYTRPGSGAGRKLVDQLFSLRRRVPQRLRYAVKQRLPRLRERAYERRSYSVVDWSRTRAFSYGTFGNIVLNVQGREEHGVVEPTDEYERIRSELAERLGDLRAPDGRPIVRAVHRREDLFEGPFMDKVPDLLVEFADYAWLGKGNLKTRADSLWDRIEIEAAEGLSYVGSHRHEGIVALAGPSAAVGTELAASIEDVAPTLLYLMGEPVPSTLEGRVLTEAVDTRVLAARPLAYADEAELEEFAAADQYAESETAEVEERLRGLGYVE